MSTTGTRPVPTPSAWSAPYWEAAREGRLVFQRGSDGSVHMYPKRLCPVTLADDLEWVESAGRGEVYTYTVQVAGPPSGFADLVPYVLAVVRLDEGFQLMTNIVGPGAADVGCGDRVRVRFHAVEGTDTVLPVFELDQDPR